MKKIFIVFLLIFISFLTGCDKELNLYEAGIDVTSSMELLVKDEAYVERMVGSHKTAINDYIASDYDTPVKVYSISKHDTDKVMEMFSEDMVGLSEEAMKQIRLNAESFSSVIGMVLNSVSGSSDLLWIANVIRCTKVYEGYTLDEECAYLYLFETGKPILVYFREVNGDVYASGYFFLQDTTLSELRDLFAPFGSEVEVIKE